MCVGGGGEGGGCKEQHSDFFLACMQTDAEKRSAELRQMEFEEQLAKVQADADKSRQQVCRCFFYFLAETVYERRVFG